MSGTDDALTPLMERYADGDPAAFRELYDAVATRLYRYAYGMLGCAATADDVVQLTFLRVHRARSSYVRGAHPLPWLYTIAHRLCVDELRRRKRAVVTVARTGDALPDVPVALDGSRYGDAELRRELSELTDEALSALSELPTNQRRAVVLLKLEGMSVAEAAEICGASETAIRLRAHRGYQHLRRRLRTG